MACFPGEERTVHGSSPTQASRPRAARATIARRWLSGCSALARLPGPRYSHSRRRSHPRAARPCFVGALRISIHRGVGAAGARVLPTAPAGAAWPGVGGLRAPSGGAAPPPRAADRALQLVRSASHARRRPARRRAPRLPGAGLGRGPSALAPRAARPRSPGASVPRMRASARSTAAARSRRHRPRWGTVWRACSIVG